LKISVIAIGFDEQNDRRCVKIKGPPNKLHAKKCPGRGKQTFGHRNIVCFFLGIMNFS